MLRQALAVQSVLETVIFNHTRASAVIVIFLLVSELRIVLFPVLIKFFLLLIFINSLRIILKLLLFLKLYAHLFVILVHLVAVVVVVSIGKFIHRLKLWE